MDLDLTGKHALVCGGSEGIGRATAGELARLGASVTLLARTEATLSVAAGALPRDAAGQNHGWLVADADDPVALRRHIEAAASAHPFHILVNNSGGPPGGPPWNRSNGIGCGGRAVISMLRAWPRTKRCTASRIGSSAPLPGAVSAPPAIAAYCSRSCGSGVRVCCAWLRTKRA